MSEVAKVAFGCSRLYMKRREEKRREEKRREEKRREEKRREEKRREEKTSQLTVYKLHTHTQRASESA